MTDRLTSSRWLDCAPDLVHMPSPRAVLLAVMLGAWLALPIPASAQAPPESGAGSIPGLGHPRSVVLLPSFGVLVENLSLTPAPGRKKIEPKLGLSYNSRGDLGVSGVGWSVDVGRIERSTAGGETFIFSLFGSGAELVPVGGNAYRARFEDVFRQFEFTGDHWEMRNDRGVIYRFGATVGSRVQGTTWMLDQVEDPNGNTMSVGYERHGGLLYVSEIRYTGHAPSNDPGPNSVLFDYEGDRTDSRVSYRLGIRQDARLRLSRV